MRILTALFVLLCLSTQAHAHEDDWTPRYATVTHNMVADTWHNSYALRVNLPYGWGWAESGSSTSSHAISLHMPSEIHTAHLGCVWKPDYAYGLGIQMLRQHESGYWYDEVGPPLFTSYTEAPGFVPRGVWLTEDFQDLALHREGGIFAVKFMGRGTVMECILTIVYVTGYGPPLP